jgi:uncharacterized protein YfiM (DUF2279 family)
MRLPRLPVLVALFVFSATSPASAQYGDEWFGEDKAKHFAACFAFAGAGYGGGALLFEEPSWARWLTGAGLGMGAGVGKELYDSRPGGSGFSLKDLAWDTVGTATGLGVAFLVDRFVFGRSESADAPASALRLRRVPGGSGGLGDGAARLSLDEPHQLLALKARVHPQQGAVPAVAAGDEHGDLSARALVHAAGGQHADLLGQAPLGERALEPARQVHAPAPSAPAQQALAADEHLHLLHRSAAAFIPHPSSSELKPRQPRVPLDAPLRAL